MGIKWDVDLDEGTIRGDFIHYRILPGDGCIALSAEWISPKLSAKVKVINKVQRSALAAYNAAVEEASIDTDFEPSWE